jgi:hypothetical protein
LFVCDVLTSPIGVGMDGRLRGPAVRRFRVDPLGARRVTPAASVAQRDSLGVIG